MTILVAMAPILGFTLSNQAKRQRLLVNTFKVTFLEMVCHDKCRNYLGFFTLSKFYFL